MEKLNSLPRVTIVIPCRNEENYIAKNIQSVLDQDYTGFCEVFVVDGMSTDNTRNIVEEFEKKFPERVKLIDNPKKFTPDALNTGIEKSSSEIFIILGGHAFLDKSFVSKNVEHLTSDPSLGCTGGVIKNIFENKEGALISKAMSSVFGVGNATFRLGGKKSLVDTVAFGAYWKKVYEQIGGFDEVLVRNQDDDYNFRVTQAGYKILFDPEIVSHYYVRGSYEQLRKQYFQYGYWKVYVNKKHKLVTSVRQLFPVLFILGILTGISLGFVHSLFWWITGSVVVLYLMMAFTFAIKLADKIAETFSLVRTFLILHFAYGFGYLKGIIDFIFFNRKPGLRATELTRN